MSLFEFWFFLGAIELLFMTVQDLRRRLVDDRLNFLMFGATASLITIQKWGNLYPILILIIVYINSYFLHKFKFFAEADFNSYIWVSTGFAYINPYLYVLFIVLFTAISLLYQFLLQFIKLEEKPFYPVFLLSFGLNIFFYYKMYSFFNPF